jgi:hypothetical protein
LEARIVAGEEEGQGGGDAGPGGFEDGEAVVLLPAVFDDERIGALFQSVAGFFDNFGAALAEEVRDEGDEGVVRAFRVVGDEGPVGEAA